MDKIDQQPPASTPTPPPQTNSLIKSPPPATPPSKPRRRRIRSELDRLLSDEGTRNLLKNLKKPKKQQQKHHVIRTRVLNSTRVFRNGIRGRKVGRNSGKGANSNETTSSSKLNNGTGGGNSRAGSPSKEQPNVIDFKYVNINKRSGVGFVTVIGGSNKLEDHGGGGGGSSATAEHHKDHLVCDGAWGLKVLQSIECAFRTLDQDSTVSVIVLQSSHSRYFCNGLDPLELVMERKGHHQTNFTAIIKAMKSLITTLNAAKKISVASISGDCVGLGVMLLPLFDFVYANDKSMFALKYNTLGQSPEGVGLMQNLLISGGLGSSKLSTLLYLNTPLTATESEQTGLVTEILWPARYQEELAVRLSALSSKSALITKTKSTLKSYKRNFKLTDLWSEFSQIETQWGSNTFQDNLKNVVLCNGVCKPESRFI